MAKASAEDPGRDTVRPDQHDERSAAGGANWCRASVCSCMRSPVFRRKPGRVADNMVDRGYCHEGVSRMGLPSSSLHWMCAGPSLGAIQGRDRPASAGVNCEYQPYDACGWT